MDIQEELREQLKLLFPEYKESGNGKEFMINCPLCAREGRSDTGFHMYISLGYDNKPPMYNCFRNSSHRGLLSDSFLEAYAINPQYLDSGLFKQIEEHNKHVSRLNRFRLNREMKYTLYMNEPKNDNRSLIKLKYINDRLGVNLSLSDISKLKIVLNLLEFLQFNQVPKYNRSMNTIQLLDEYFIGFLSNTNSLMKLRKIVPDGKLPEYIDKRYMTYRIIEDAVNTGYYIIPSLCDITKHICINIAEGTFDILSVFLNLKNKNIENNIYLAIGSNSYLQAIKYFLEEYGLIDIEFHIYIDNDIKPDVLPSISESIKPLGHRIFIHVNMYQGEKDFGVPLNRISEYIYEL